MHMSNARNLQNSVSDTLNKDEVKNKEIIFSNLSNVLYKAIRYSLNY